jgi:hypothetical protein
MVSMRVLLAYRTMFIGSEVRLVQFVGSSRLPKNESDNFENSDRGDALVSSDDSTPQGIAKSKILSTLSRLWASPSHISDAEGHSDAAVWS